MKMKFRDIMICNIIEEISQGHSVRIIDKLTETIYTETNMTAEELCRIWTTNDYDRYYCYVIEMEKETQSYVND